MQINMKHRGSHIKFKTNLYNFQCFVYFISCLSIVYWNITMDYILIIYCLKQWNYQNLVARFNVNFNTERKQHREPKSLTRFLIGALNGVIKLLSGWKIKFLTNRTTEKHEIKRKFVCFGERSKIISLVNTRHYIFHSWKYFVWCSLVK